MVKPISGLVALLWCNACSLKLNNTSCHSSSCSLLQIQGDLEDLESALGVGATSRVVGSGSCSALVKLLPGNSELLVSHDTWSDYHGMLRIFKHYDLKFRMTNGSSKWGLNSYVSCRRGKPRFREFSSFFLLVLIVLLKCSGVLIHCTCLLYWNICIGCMILMMPNMDTHTSSPLIKRSENVSINQRCSLQHVLLLLQWR